MLQYASLKLNISLEEADKLKGEIYEKYSTFGLGLFDLYHFNMSEYYEYVHHIDLQEYIAYSPELIKILQEITIPKYILTNADRFHVIRVLRILKATELFDGIIDVLDTHPYGKPSIEAFDRALYMTNKQDVTRCVFVDDQARNVIGAKNAGFFTIQVSVESSGDADRTLSKIEDFPQLDIYDSLKRVTE